MPYIGRSEQFGVRTVFHFLASNGDTSISGNDADGKALSFTDGNYIDVYLNGVRLKSGEDYNTSTANTVAGLSALNANDEVNIVVYDAFAVSDTVPASAGGTFSGNVTFSNDISVGDDASFNSDGAVINFGADSEVNLTHVADTGILVNSTNKIQFNDASQFIHGSSATVLSLGATDEIDLTATAIDINGTADISGALTGTTATFTTADNSDQLTLKSTDADASSGPSLSLTRDSGSPADNDAGGKINFNFDDDGGNVSRTAAIFTTLVDASAGSEDGKIHIETMIGGAEGERFGIGPTEVVVNEPQVDLDFRVESADKDAMIFVDAGNNRLQIGSTTTDDDQMFQLIQTSGSAGFGIHTNRAAAGGSALILSKSRNASVGSFTIVQDNDSLGRITFQGDDGGDIKTEAAEISAEIDGTPGSNDMPCRIAFKTTADGANSTTERCEIDPEGAFHLGRSAQALDASGVSLMPNAQSQFITMGNDVKPMAVGSGNDVQLTVVEFISGNAVRGSIGVTISATSFNTSSDVRLKENIEDAKSSGSIIDQIQVREFDWKTGEHQRHGMIAQELNEVAPEAVTTDEVHEGDMWTVDYSKLVPMMMKEIQDLRKRVKELEDK